MGRSYKQLSLDDRCEIACLSANGSSVRQIAAALDRSPSTVSRELRRNRGSQVGYKPNYAQHQMRARRWTGGRLEREPGLRRAVLQRLRRGWSPEQVAGRLARESGRKVISHETIYRFIYAQLRRTTDFNWRRYLPRAKSKRGRRGKRGGSPASFIEGRVSLANRPIEVADRSVPGHWEADLMMFSKYGQAVLTVHERTSRLLLGIRLASKVARGVARHLVGFFATLPQELRQTVTFDNGTEFAGHLALHRLSIETFFCDPHAPWQKGGIENAIGRMRRFIPRKTDLVTLSTARFRQFIAAYNNTPRKCLDYRTPAEAFAQVLHFECESTSRLSPGRRWGSNRGLSFSPGGRMRAIQYAAASWLNNGRLWNTGSPACAGDDAAWCGNLNREPSSSSSLRKQGPITTEANCYALLRRRVPPTTFAAAYGPP
ncbi:IS30 family transposase [Bradyrhizobium pachyrhizi]|nr:IS30 family transposase [Bradyrhizobium pachyrhizi]WFU58859.1 IS30 family transposase [Bradyrhizobium pachyrhizi]